MKWAAGTGAKGTDGVAAMVSNTRGAIGYVESAYAWENKLTTTKLQNASGKFVAPTMKSYTAAAAAADWSKVQNFAVDLNNEPGADSWPIESATFVLLPINPDAAAQSPTVVKFFDWSFTKGNDLATQLQYISLPNRCIRRCGPRGRLNCRAVSPSRRARGRLLGRTCAGSGVCLSLHQPRPGAPQTR